jgi:dinuclear metal center YbgI/SA1388 family protein
MADSRAIARTKLVRHLDDYLKTREIHDRSLNGLQVEGSARVRRAAFAVDASLAAIRGAARLGAELLVVHHGLFWSENERITGVMRQRIGALVENDMSLYAAHLPLDCHSEVGNNIELVRLLGLQPGERFADYHGVVLGYVAATKVPVTRAALSRKIASVLRCRVERLDFGPPTIRRIGIVSGGAAEFVADAKDLGCDALITGETSHTAYHTAKEARINVFFAGHYASETVGVKALARHLRDVFGLDCRFISAPTGY